MRRNFTHKNDIQLIIFQLFCEILKNTLRKTQRNARVHFRKMVHDRRDQERSLDPGKTDA